MWNRIKYILLLCVFAGSNELMGQNPMNVEMADALRANGKIYVVVVVAGLVFTGILAYLIYIDRKLNKLEKELRK